MANPTTNFGWVMPTSSSLVTNLPADFNTFGQAVDTSMSELLGGTTGQVLSKTSNTSMDFTWVTPTDQTPLTTKGDLFTFTTVDARLGVGTNGQVLQADSTTATGLKWATAGGGGKLLQLTSTQITSYVQIASTTMTDTNITASITPTSATSKILVTITACVRTHVNTATNPSNSKFNIVRGATTIVQWLDGRFFQVLGDGFAQITVQYLDSPATTSATTYKAQSSVDSTADGRYVEFQLSSYPSTITLMEIGA